MTDAVVLLAIAQLITLGGLGYLYAQLQSLRRDMARPGTEAVPARMPLRTVNVETPPAGAMSRKPAPADAPAHRDLAALVARMNELGVDIPSLARRMRRSEDEIRMLLRSEGAGY